VALFGTYIGSAVSANSGRQTQERQLAEDRAKTEREKRAEIYFRFMSDIDAYYRRQSEVEEACAPSLTGGVAVDVQTSRLIACLQGDAKLTALLDPLKKSRNELYVYGSNEANTVVDEMLKQFPLVVHPVNFQDDFVLTFTERLTLSVNFLLDYRKFQGVACRDLPPNPRSTC
jgi:hypothetical protein